MPTKSKIAALPKDLRDQLNAWLRDKSRTCTDIALQLNELLAEHGIEAVISRSAVNRYAQKMDKAGAKIQQSREIAEMWIGKLGAMPQGKVGLLLNELVRTLAFDAAVKLGQGERAVTPKMLREMATAIQRLEQATSLSVKREAEIRAQAAEAAGKVAKKQGLSADTAKAIREAIEGAE